MTAQEIAVHLLTSCTSLAEFDSYMFGSSLRGLGRDIDILVVGPAGEKLKRLKQEIAIAGRELPLDVLYLSPSEELETGFVAGESCVPLATLALGDN